MTRTVLRPASPAVLLALVVPLLTAPGLGAQSVPAQAPPAPATSTPPSSRPVLAIRELRLKPGADTLAFERYVAEVYAPTVAARIPGFRAYLLKGDRGVRKGQYLLVWEIESVAMRDRYFPTEAGPASAELRALTQGMPAWEFDRWLEPERPFTDFIVLR